MGSILFSILDLPEEAAAPPPIAAQGAGEQLKTRAVAGPSAGVSNGGAGVDGSGGAPKSGKGASKKAPKRVGGGEGSEQEGDSFSRIEIRVGKITKARRRENDSTLVVAAGSPLPKKKKMQTC